MWAQLGKFLIVELVIPLIKDGVFMLMNFFKVRQLRKDQEAKANAAVKEYAKTPTADNFNKLP